MLHFIVDTDSDDGATLYVGYDSTVTRPPRDLIRNDETMEFSVEPVTVNAPGDSTIFTADYEATDTFELRIGPIDEAPTGGEFSLDVGGTTTNLTGLDYNVTAAALQTPLSAAFVTETYSACEVTLLNEGVYQIDATANGAIPSGVLTGIASQLQPACEIAITEVELGDGSTPYQLLLVLRQSAIASAVPATALTAAGVTATNTQALSLTANKIVTVSMDAARTYGGTFSVSATVNGVTQTCGIATPGMSASEFAEMLTGHPSIEFQNPDGTADNVSVTKNGSSFIVEFTGTQGASGSQRTINAATVANPTVITTTAAHNAVSGQSVTISGSTGTTPSLDGTHTITKIDATSFSIPVNVTVSASATGTVLNNTQPALTATNINLLAPKGRSGTISLNTINLYKYSLALDTDVFAMPFQIKRARASGESRKIFLGDGVLKKEIIDTSTMVTLPNGALSANNVWTGTNNFSAQGLTGTDTNDNAGVGIIGEYLSTVVTEGSAVSNTSTVTDDVATISITPGDWDVEGLVNIKYTGATVTGDAQAGISLTGLTLPSDGTQAYSGLRMTTTTANDTITVTRKRVSFAGPGTETIYLVAQSTFSAGTAELFGFINARRVR